MKTLLPSTREELDRMRCECGKCKPGELWFKGMCHPDAGVEAIYNQKTGILKVICFQCKKPVVEVYIAKALIVP